MDQREHAARAIIDECNASGARDRYADAIADKTQILNDLRQRGAHCRTCAHYAHTHVGGPRGAGWCGAKKLPAHGNTCACVRWEAR